MTKKFSPSARYGLALASVAVATLLRILAHPLLGAEFPFATYYVAVILVMCFAGFCPALLTVALGWLSADVFFYTFDGARPEPLAIFNYLCVTLVITLFGKGRQDARYRMELSLKESREHQKDLEEEMARRMETESALQLSEEQFRASFDLPGVGMAQIDPGSGRFVRVNSKLCEMTGYTPEELLDMTLRQLTYPGDSDYDSKVLRKMIEGVPSQTDVERRYVCKGGRIIWVSVASALIRDREGRPWRTATVIQDVTARHKAEEALQTAQHRLRESAVELEKQVAERTGRLSEAVQSLEQFCYSIAHDLRTPIRAMHGYAQALAQDAPLTAEGSAYTQKISKAAAHMDQLVSDLLMYGRMACEPIDLRAVALEAVVDQALRQLQPEISSVKAQVWVARPLPAVMGDSPVLQQIVTNLLRNAVTFVGPGIQPVVHIRAEETGSMVRLTVEDNGIGIEPQYLDRVFNVFERLHSQQHYPGTGIGLAIVKKGVERMGGRVAVSSHPGDGSCFWFELPNASAPVIPSSSEGSLLPTAAVQPVH